MLLKCSVYEIFCLCKAVSKKGCIYEMRCLCNAVSMKCCVFEKSIYLRLISCVHSCISHCCTPRPKFCCLYLCFLSLERKPLAREQPIIHLEGHILASVVGQILASVSVGK